MSSVMRTKDCDKLFSALSQIQINKSTDQRSPQLRVAMYLHMGAEKRTRSLITRARVPDYELLRPYCCLPLYIQQ